MAKNGDNKHVAARTVSESRVEMAHLVLPNDTNPLGNILGGTVMHLIDLCAAIVAMRHARRRTVTASMDHLDFLNPIKMGEIVILKGTLNYVARSSMEIGVDVYSEDVLTGDRKRCCTAHLTFVAINDQGTPTEVPRLILRTRAERQKFEEAAERRRQRMRGKAAARPGGGSRRSPSRAS